MSRTVRREARFREAKDMKLATQDHRAGTGGPRDRGRDTVCDRGHHRDGPRVPVLKRSSWRNCRGGSQGPDVCASSCSRCSPSCWGCAEAWPMQRREPSPTCSVCSSMPDAEKNCCEAERRPSALCSPWGLSWTSCFNCPLPGRCIQAQPWWLGRFLFASPTPCPEH